MEGGKVEGGEGKGRGRRKGRDGCRWSLQYRCSRLTVMKVLISFPFSRKFNLVVASEHQDHGWVE